MYQISLGLVFHLFFNVFKADFRKTKILLKRCLKFRKNDGQGYKIINFEANFISNTVNP